MSADASWQFLEQFLAGELSPADFEQWLQTTPGLEGALGPRVHGALVGFDFRRGDATPELHGLVRSLYESARPARLARDRGFRIARGLLSGSVAIQDGVRALAGLCLDGHDWVPAIFVKVQWEFDGIPRPEQYSEWEPTALSAKLEEGRRLHKVHRESILDGAREIIASYRAVYGE